MDKPVAEKSELVIDALQYAHEHNLDINVVEDVQKILDVLDLDHKENAVEFAELLKTSDTFMGIKAKEIKAKEPQLPN